MEGYKNEVELSKRINGMPDAVKCQMMLRKLQDEFYEKERLSIAADPDLTFGQLMAWGLKQEVMKVKASYSDDVQRAKILNEHLGHFKACS